MEKITRKSKDYNPMTNEPMLPSNLDRTRADFIRGITFLIRFVGRLEIDRPTNKDEIIAAMRRVRQEYKLRSFKKRSASLTISIDGISVALMKKKFVPRSTDTVEISWHHPINKVFYVSHDSRDLKVFSYIARDVPTNQFVCIVFKTSKEIATNIVSTIGKAFEVVHLMNNTKSDPTSPEVPRAASPDTYHHSSSKGDGHPESRRLSNQGLMTRSYSSTGITTDLLHPLELPEKAEQTIDDMIDREDELENELETCPFPDTDEMNSHKISTIDNEQPESFDKKPIYADENFLIEEEEEDVPDEHVPQETDSTRNLNHGQPNTLEHEETVTISEKDLLFLKSQLVQLTKTLNLERRSNQFTELRLEKLSYEFYLMKDHFTRIIKKLAKSGVIDDNGDEYQASDKNCCLCKNFLAHCLKSQCPHSNPTYNRSVTCYDIKSQAKSQKTSAHPFGDIPRAETFTNEFGEFKNTKANTLKITSNYPTNKLFKNASFDHTNSSSMKPISKMVKLRHASCYKFNIPISQKDEKKPEMSTSNALIQFSPCKRSSTMFEMSEIVSSNETKDTQDPLSCYHISMVTSKSHDFSTIREVEETQQNQQANPMFNIFNNNHDKVYFESVINRESGGIKESKSDQSLFIKPLPPPLNDTESNRKRIRKAQTLTETTNLIGQEFLVKLD